MSDDAPESGVVGRLLRTRGASAWLWLSLVVIVLDQLTKRIAVAYLEYARPKVVMPYLDFTLLHNTGAAFSFLANAGGWQRWLFVSLGIAVSALVVYWVPRLPQKGQARLAAALALIMGGALGNVIDRLAYGYVIDFIHAHYDKHYWPAFNVADMAISVGAALLIIDSIFPGKPDGADTRD